MKVYIFLAISILLTSQYLATSKEKINLEFCHIANYGQEVKCGTYDVFEDRVAASGRKINIKFAVIPSVTEAKELDPLVFFAGGPGQAATDMGRFIKIAFSKINETRDVILIDQRGMGGSNGLDCEQPDELEDIISLSTLEQEKISRDLLTKCLAELDADVTKYTQDIANQDIHEILLELGYDRVNLYGVSWGTRSALLYANQFPDHVRSIIADGNAPIENKVSLYATADAESSLQALFKDCADNAECNKAYPELEQTFNTVLKTFGETGKATTINDPNSDKSLEFTMTRDLFVSALRNFLYSSDFSRIIPLIIKQAEANDFRALAALGAAFGDSAGMSIGATLTILCSEDFSRMDEAEITTEMNKGFVGDAFYKGFTNLCSVWPKAPLPAIYNQSLTSNVPSLILSGKIDPITPPRWGDIMAKSLTNSIHLVAPHTGHNVAPKGCTSDLMSQFVNQGNTENIDAECLNKITRPTFFVDASGPAGSNKQ